MIPSPFCARIIKKNPCPYLVYGRSSPFRPRVFNSAEVAILQCSFLGRNRAKKKKKKKKKKKEGRKKKKILFFYFKKLKNFLFVYLNYDPFSFLCTNNKKKSLSLFGVRKI
eukprot:TRINITY_DN592_c0_g2_i8.p1 TRINITY_DN592_c0_g2~~TRINITY_DN592_c0_g2_i8.p1  ORF type:complete len:111 (+),score=7.07 TRINITY_DN592_c0_g2_i8:41-373(+)